MEQELRHYWHSNMANAPEDGEKELPREQGPGPQLLPQWRGNERTLAQQEGGWQKSGLLAGLSRYKLWAKGSQDVYPVHAVSPIPLLFRLEITESWPGSPLHFGRQGNKCLSYPSYIEAI